MNIALLRKVQRSLKKEPRRLDMDVPIAVAKPWRGGPPCGTTACIAGEALILSRGGGFRQAAMKVMAHLAVVDPYGGWDAIEFAAIKKLRLTKEQAQRLFHDERWPDEFYYAYENATTARKRASITIRRIDHFIATGGDQ
jgi:hypothetical protein